MAGFNLDDFEVIKAETLSTPNSILIYGPPGKGKTVFAASISKVPGFERTLVIDTEGSSVALGPHYPGVDVIKAPTAAQFTKVAEALLNGKLVERESGLPYQCVIIDTLDKAQTRQLAVFAASPEARNKNGEENSFFKWGALKLWTEKIGDLFHQADFLTIFVLHSDIDKNEDTGKTTTGVMLAGKSQQIFPSTPDAVCYFDVVPVDEGGKKVPKRAADFRVSAKLITKQRFAEKLNALVVDPTFEKVFRAIEPARFN